MKRKMLREMFDTPYHIGYVKMDEFDSRRDKRRCIYFTRNEIHKSYCMYISSRCPGSSHCKFYDENIEHMKTNDELIKEIWQEFEAEQKYREYRKELSQKKIKHKTSLNNQNEKVKNNHLIQNNTDFGNDESVIADIEKNKLEFKPNIIKSKEKEKKINLVINVLRDNILFEIVMKYIYKKKIIYKYFKFDNNQKIDDKETEISNEIKCITIRDNDEIKLISETDYKNFVRSNNLEDLNIEFNFKDDSYKNEIIDLIEN